MRRNLLIALWLLAALPACAQLPTVGDGRGNGPVQAQHLTVELVRPSVAQGAERTEFWSGLIFRLDAGWHVYWVNPGDSGLPPSVEWSLPNGINAEAMLFPAPKRLPLGPLMDYGYEQVVVFPIHMRVSHAADGSVGHVQAKVDWIVCREVCLPGRALLGYDYKFDGVSFSMPPPISLSERMVLETLKNLPVALSAGKATLERKGDQFELSVDVGTQITKAEVFPLEPNIIVNSAPQKVQPTATGARILLQRDPSLGADPLQISMVVECAGHGTFTVSANVLNIQLLPQGHTTSSSGGTMANSAVNTRAMDGASVVDGAAEHGQSTAHLTVLAALGLAFVGGLILNLMPCVFPVLFLKAIGLVSSGTEERSRLRVQGLVYTLGILVSFWVVVGLLLVLRAGGARLGWGFQLQSAGFVAVLACGLFVLALALLGVFEMGLGVTSAGGKLAAKQGLAGSFWTGVLATVVATPCTAPLMGAAIGYALAQSAGVAFAVFTAVALGLAAPYVALTLAPAWTKLLPRPGAWMDVLKRLTALPLLATVAWMGWLLMRLRTRATVWEMVVVLAVLTLICAAWGRWHAKRMVAAVLVGLVLCALLPLHHPVDHWGWQPYSADALAAARAEHKPVFVDFTAAWCLSCRFNEMSVLNTKEVQHALTDGGYVLLRADWTKYDPKITEALAGVGRSGVPTYVVYPADGGGAEVLPELLTKGEVLSAIGSNKR